MATQHLTDKNPDGTVFGQATTEKISFYGATTVDRPNVASAATAVATTVAVSASTGTAKWGFSTSTQANDILALVNGLLTDLEELGIIG